mmetsp:Transcript_22481/g.34671  ORF Transcript_22481/g.34671 Transcript_22481/m.34671 type:complete len:239 (-) Transcript_22481:128-844(-)
MSLIAFGGESSSEINLLSPPSKSSRIVASVEDGAVINLRLLLLPIPLNALIMSNALLLPLLEFEIGIDKSSTDVFEDAFTAFRKSSVESSVLLPSLVVLAVETLESALSLLLLFFRLEGVAFCLVVVELDNTAPPNDALTSLPSCRLERKLSRSSGDADLSRKTEVSDLSNLVGSLDDNQVLSCVDRVCFFLVPLVLPGKERDRCSIVILEGLLGPTFGTEDSIKFELSAASNNSWKS